MSYEKGTLTSVRGIITNENNEILLLHRAMTPQRKSNPGLWEIVGGKLDREELATGNNRVPRKVLVDALGREISEETGLVMSTVGAFNEVDRRPIDSNRRRGVYICYAAFVGVLPGEIVLNPEEHDAFRWENTTKPIASDITTETTNAIVMYNQFALGLSPR